MSKYWVTEDLTKEVGGWVALQNNFTLYSMQQGNNRNSMRSRWQPLKKPDQVTANFASIYSYQQFTSNQYITLMDLFYV